MRRGGPWATPSRTTYTPTHKKRLSAPTSGSLRRRARERRQAEETRAEGERIAQERRQQKARDKIECQRKAREELASYEPWGKGGGGAPNPRGVRFTNIRAKGIFPEDELRIFAKYGISVHDHWVSSRQRQHRAPLRLREDPQLCYADNLRKSVDNDIRYKQTPDQQQHYKRILDEMVDKRNRAIKEEIKRNLEFERKMQTMASPWGKPGPGGTTWRNPRNIGLNFSKSMGWTDNEIFKKLNGDHGRYKRSSLALPKVKGDDDWREDDLHEKENKNAIHFVEKLPVIKSCPNERTQGERRRTSIEDKQKTDVNILNEKGKRSPINNKFMKKSNGERVRQAMPDEDDYGFKNGNNKNSLEKKLTPETSILRLTGGVELVPLLARRRRVGARTLPSSDVTRPPEQSCQWREMLDGEHLSVLKHQMRVKSEQKEKSRRDSAESVRQHNETWASLWGRPGHGAPQQRGRYAMSNLAHLLYVAPFHND